MKSERNNGIDLLRIILMIMICILHVLDHGGILTNSKTTLGYYSSHALKAFCICAVDTYALISGYFASNKEQNYKRIIKLWLTALFYSLLSIFIIVIYNKFNSPIIELNIDMIKKAFMPVSFGNWYFRAYFAVFFISPFINKSLDDFDEKQSRKFLILLLIVFSFTSLQNNIWFDYGYNAFWILVLYIFGALIKKSNILLKIDRFTLLLLFFISSFSTFILETYLENNSWGDYTSPTVLFSAMCLLVLFSNITIKNKMIKKIAPLTFGVYLFHDNDYIRHLFIKNKFIFVDNYSFIVIILLSLIISFFIFIISCLVDYLRLKIFYLLKVDDFIDKTLKKLHTIIK